MGYPHKPHPKETVVLSQYFGDFPQEAEGRLLPGTAVQIWDDF